MTTGSARRNLLAVWGLALFALLLCGAARAGLEEKLEKSVGSQIAQEVERQTGVVRDPCLAGWVERVGRRLVSVSSRGDLQYTFKILDSQDINAIAIPGGHVYVTKGLLRFIQSEDELAAVLGHEVGHIAARHSNKQIKTQVLASIALSSFKNRRYSSAVGMARLGGLFAMLKFSRDHENDADLLGLEGLTALGYDPDQMMEFFKRLNEREKHKPSKFEVYLMTHPTFKDRMSRIGARPEMTISKEGCVRMADNLRARALVNQARRDYRAALSLDQSYAPALSALKDLPAAPAKAAESPVELLSDSDLLGAQIVKGKEAIEAQATTLERREKSLLKQLRSTASSLSFASSYVNPYDPIQMREFALAAQALDDASKFVGDARTLIDDAREAAAAFVDVAGRLPSDGSPGAVQTRRRFAAEAPGGMEGISAALKDAAETAKRASNAFSSLDFAVRQLQGYLLAPGPTGLPLGGGLEVQLRAADESIRGHITACRRHIATEEKARSLALRTDVDLLACAAFTSGDSAARIAGHYLGRSPSADTAGSLGDAIARAAAGNTDTEVDHSCVNILLELIANDLARENAAAIPGK